MEIYFKNSVYTVARIRELGENCFMKHWEIERLFNDDVRDKRKTGSGVFHRRGKGVKHGISGALRTPSYYMSNKEKKKLNGEVKVWQMYETILPVDEFRLKDTETQKAMLTRWREVYTNEDIKKTMRISNKTLYDIIGQLELPRKARGGNNTHKNRAAKTKKMMIETLGEKTLLDFETSHNSVKPTEVIKPIVITEGLHLEFNGKYDVESLNRLFTKLQLLVDGETCKYNIALSLTEIKQNEE